MLLSFLRQNGRIRYEESRVKFEAGRVKADAWSAQIRGGKLLWIRVSPTADHSEQCT
jgi:hypothetical protein